MDYSKTRFLLVLCALCMPFSHTVAAPSVRVLGANNSGIKAVPAKTGGTTTATKTNSGNVKKASVKTTGVTPKQQVLTPSTERIGTTIGAGRLPVIATKTNLQTGYKSVGNVSTVNTAAANTNELSDRIDALQLDLDKKADSVDLENYYTKPEIDEKFSEIDGLVSENGEFLTEISERVTQNESDIEDIDNRVEINDGKITIMTNQINDINTRINNIDTISSIQYVQELQNRIAGYELQLGEVVASAKKIYDAGTNTFKMVRLVDNFDASVLTESND